MDISMGNSATDVSAMHANQSKEREFLSEIIGGIVMHLIWYQDFSCSVT